MGTIDFHGRASTEAPLGITAAPAAGVEVTADFDFDVPVRFDIGHMAVTIETFRLHRWQQIPIAELRSSATAMTPLPCVFGSLRPPPAPGRKVLSGVGRLR